MKIVFNIGMMLTEYLWQKMDDTRWGDLQNNRSPDTTLYYSANEMLNSYIDSDDTYLKDYKPLLSYKIHLEKL